MARKRSELIILESLEKKISELLDSIEIEVAEEEPHMDYAIENEDLDKIELSEEVFEQIESYCENKNNLVIGIS